jgi:hypothetical protein|tara:strand:- start:2276 stop:2434 length:159 start_codon:yes stop_codon:yes gene_type:complete
LYNRGHETRVAQVHDAAYAPWDAEGVDVGKRRDIGLVEFYADVGVVSLLLFE